MIAQKRKINWNNPVYLDRETAAQYGVVTAYPGKGYGSQRLFDIRGKYHGTLTNGPTWTTGKFGEPAFTCDGTDDYVSLSAIKLIYSGFVSMWWRPNESVASNDHPLFRTTDGTSFLDLYPYLGSIYYGWVSGSDQRRIWAISGVTTGAWHHIAMTFTNGAGVQLYLNGSNVDGGNVATAWDISTATTTRLCADQAASSRTAATLTNVVFGTTISPNYITELYRNPLLFYWQPSPRKLFFFRQTTAVRRQAKAASKVRRLVLHR